MDRKKQRQVVETAQRLLRRKAFRNVLRFDIVGVYLNDRDEPIRAEHFENAFDRSVLKKRQRSTKDGTDNLVFVVAVFCRDDSGLRFPSAPQAGMLVLLA